MGATKKEGYSLEDSIEQVGSGWTSLVKKVFEELKKYPTFRIIQVKEKFGRLRVYFDYNHEDYSIFQKLTDEDKQNEGSNWKKFYHFLNTVEEESGRVCELCGNPGICHVEDAWIITRCSDCYSTPHNSR